MTRHQLAAILGVHPDRLSEYAQAGMPVHKRGGGGSDDQRRNRYDAIACAQWVRRHRSGGIDAQRERAQLDQTRRAEIEHRMKLRSSEYAKAHDLEARFAQRVVNGRAKMLGIPSSVKQVLPDFPAVGLAEIDRVIREVLDDLAADADRSEGGA